MQKTMNREAARLAGLAIYKALIIVTTIEDKPGDRATIRIDSRGLRPFEKAFIHKTLKGLSWHENF